MPESSLLVVRPTARSVALQDLPESAFRIISGKPLNQDGFGPYDLFATVPWLYRGIKLRMDAVGRMPYEISKQGSDEPLEDDDALAAIPWLKSFRKLLAQTELSLCMDGAAYWFVQRNRVKTLGYRWIWSGTVKPQVDPTNGLTGWTRVLNGREPQPLKLNDLVYWWLPSPNQELAPGPSPAAAAISAAGLVRYVDEWGQGFFKRGATPLTLLSVEGNPPQAELERLEKWWKRMLAGVRRAWETVAVKASVEPKIIGTVPKDLALYDLTQSKREDIATALGIPHSLLFSDAANFATAQQDDLHFYTKTVLPECDFLAEGLNEQVFGPAGYVLKFKPERLELFEAQEDEKANALVGMYTADILTREEVREQLGYDPEPKLGMFRSDTAAAQPQQPMGKPVAEIDDDVSEDSAAKRAELASWRRKALRAVNQGKSADVAFTYTAHALPDPTITTIAQRLSEASSAEEVRAAFRGPFRRGPDRQYP